MGKMKVSAGLTLSLVVFVWLAGCATDARPTNESGAIGHGQWAAQAPTGGAPNTAGSAGAPGGDAGVGATAGAGGLGAGASAATAGAGGLAGSAGAPVGGNTGVGATAGAGGLSTGAAGGTGGAGAGGAGGAGASGGGGSSPPVVVVGADGQVIIESPVTAEDVGLSCFLQNQADCDTTPGCGWNSEHGFCLDSYRCVYPIPEDALHYDDFGNQLAFVISPCASTPSDDFFDTPPAVPPPVANGGTASNRGAWNYDSRRAFYGNAYTGTSTLVIGSPTYGILEQTPTWRLSTHLSNAQLQAIADTCGTLAGWQQVICASINCRAAEVACSGVCRHTASCTTHVLRRMGWTANVYMFSFNFTAGHAVVEVQDGGSWYIIDPTWSATAYWSL